MTTTLRDQSIPSRTSTSTTSAPAGTGGPTPLGVLRSEWVKLRSLRSNIAIVLGAAAVLIATGIVFSGFVGGVFKNADEAAQLAHDPVGATLQGTLLSPLVIGALGVMAMAGEYATGTIRTSLTMVPTRLPVLWAKVAVVAAVSFITMLAAATTAFVIGQALISQGPHATASLADADTIRALVGTAGYLAATALIGIGIGGILRNPAAALATLGGVMLLLPGIGSILLPTSWQRDVMPYLPSNAGVAMTQVVPDPGLLSPGAAALVLLAHVVVSLGAAAVVLRVRPA